MTKILLWEGTDVWRAEVSCVEPGPETFHACGTQLGVDPVPYRLDYELELGPRWVTRRISVTSTGQDWERRLMLSRDEAGSWACEAEERGSVPLAAPGCDPRTLFGALDCDLGCSPLTNTMPVLRHGLAAGPGAVDAVMAWIAVPGLDVHPSEQRYEHRGPDGPGSIVGYRSGNFAAELRLDAEGFVLDYPGLARAVPVLGPPAQASSAIPPSSGWTR